MRLFYKAILLISVTCFLGCKKNPSHLRQTTVPTIQITEIFEIKEFEIKIKTKVLDFGSAGIDSGGIVVSTTASPTIDQYFLKIPLSSIVSNSTDSTFISHIQGLQKNTTYHVRVYAKSGTNIYYSNDASFTTNSFPKVQIIEFIQLSISGLFIKAKILDYGNSGIDSGGFVVSNTPLPTIDNYFLKVPVNGVFNLPDRTFTTSIQGLHENSTYYVRFYAKTGANTSYSNDTSFTTQQDGTYFPIIKNLPTNLVIGTSLRQNSYWYLPSPFFKNKYAENNLVLPQGIKMYAIIDSVRGQHVTHVGTGQVVASGDIIEIPFGTSIHFSNPHDHDFTAPDEHRWWVYYSVKLMGTTTDAQYFCRYQLFINGTNSTEGHLFNTLTNYVCNTQ